MDHIDLLHEREALDSYVTVLFQRDFLLMHRDRLYGRGGSIDLAVFSSVQYLQKQFLKPLILWTSLFFF